MFAHSSDFVVENAFCKAKEVVGRVPEGSYDFIVSADTVVVRDDDKILEKPDSAGLYL